MAFKTKMEKTAEEKQSRIVLALDFPFQNPPDRGKLFAKAEQVLNTVHPHICAIKLNHHLTLPLGVFDGVQKLVKKAHDAGLMTIMDCKVNDIGATNQVIAEYYYAAGFDCLIANPFIGWEEGLEPVFQTAKKQRRGVVLLVYMSHKGAYEGYGQTIIDNETGRNTPQYLVFATKALNLKADGVVVGATYPQKIKEVYRILGDSVSIYSPGIGAQGGEIKAALEAGTRYLIVGRAIVQAQKPAEAAKQIKETANQVINSLR